VIGFPRIMANCNYNSKINQMLKYVGATVPQLLFS
jgi:hypothetical protein